MGPVVDVGEGLLSLGLEAWRAARSGRDALGTGGGMSGDEGWRGGGRLFGTGGEGSVLPVVGLLPKPISRADFFGL